MAFPWTTEENFEGGTIASTHFDANSDSGDRMAVRHYSELARDPRAAAPYSGAYCLALDLEKSSTNAYLQETGSWDMTAGSAELYVRFMLYVSNDLTMATTNEFTVFEFWSSTNTAEAGVMINYTTANGLRIGIGKSTASSFLGFTTGTWHCVELFFDPAGGAGTLDGWLDGASFAQVDSLTNANITSGIVGVINQDAGTTKGLVMVDEVITDDAQIYKPEQRFSHQKLLTKSGHAFIGPGILENITLLSGAGTDNVATVFDTDTANTNDAFNVGVQLKNTANNETVDTAACPAQLNRGCYVTLSGTNPRAIAQFRRTPAWGSDGAIKNYGLKQSI